MNFRGDEAHWGLFVGLREGASGSTAFNICPKLIGKMFAFVRARCFQLLMQILEFEHFALQHHDTIGNWVGGQANVGGTWGCCNCWWRWGRFWMSPRLRNEWK